MQLECAFCGCQTRQLKGEPWGNLGPVRCVDIDACDRDSLPRRVRALPMPRSSHDFAVRDDIRSLYYAAKRLQTLGMDSLADTVLSAIEYETVWNSDLVPEECLDWERENQ